MGKRKSSWCPAWRVACALLLLSLALPTWGWTPASQLSIAESAAQLAPPDLLRQIAKHRKEYREGVVAAFRDRDPSRHYKDPTGRGTLDTTWLAEVDGAIAAIRTHRPFADVAFRLGTVSHYLADANFPLNTSSADGREPEYFADFARYLESAEPRVQAVFYGIRPQLVRSPSLQPLLSETFTRSRGLYSLVGREYRRFPTVDGRRNFDDRSTAFALAALCYSHAVTDVAEALRYVWIKAGGADSRTRLPERGKLLVRIPKANEPVPAR